jgi:3-oxoacyl-[acyl-carrier protein] reductase
MGRALVTGGARGLGAAIVDALRAAGHAVTPLDRDADALAAAGGGIACDVTNRAQVEEMVEQIQPDILVNNAGVSIVRPVLDLSLEDWDRVLRVNLTGAFLMSQAAASHMAGQGGGRIVNITSTSGQRGGTGRAAYGASKGGLEILTKVMAVELAPMGITVNAVAPGPVETDLVAATHTDATRSAYLAAVPMRRYGAPVEIAAAVAFLASDAASYVTGHVLNADGGFGAAGVIYDAGAK